MRYWPLPAERVNNDGVTEADIPEGQGEKSYEKKQSCVL